jgi:hypothetical protein
MLLQTHGRRATSGQCFTCHAKKVACCVREAPIKLSAFRPANNPGKKLAQLILSLCFAVAVCVCLGWENKKQRARVQERVEHEKNNKNRERRVCFCAPNKSIFPHLVASCLRNEPHALSPSPLLVCNMHPAPVVEKLHATWWYYASTYKQTRWWYLKYEARCTNEWAKCLFYEQFRVPSEYSVFFSKK